MRRPLVRWGLDGLLVLVSIVGALVAVEIGLRYFHPMPMGVWHQDREGLALHWPGLVSYLPQHGLTVSFNSEGMRDAERSVTKAPGVFRVLVLGDSFIEALQVPFEDSFTSLLERELHGRTPRRIEVMNASVSGWGTDDELQYLTNYGRRFRPDLVLVAMTLYNDISDNLRERFHTIRDGALVTAPSTRTSPLQYRVLQVKGFLATRLHTYQLITRARRAREIQVEGQRLSTHVSGLFAAPDPRLARGFELTRLLLERMRLVAAADGGTVVLVLIPLGVQLSDRQFAEFVGARPGEGGAAAIDAPQRQLTRISQQAGIDVIDLLSGFREWAASGGAALYLSRDGHWDRPGHRLSAQIVASELLRRGAVPR